MLTYISGFLTRLMGKSRNSKGASTLDPKILSRKEHSLSRKDLSQYVLKVLYRLQQAGYQAYLVGGGVRDVLLGLHPKDFDVATDALPEQVYQLFRNSRMIGRRFRLVHVFFGDHIVEVATFRAQHPEAEKIQYDSHSAKRAEGGMLIRDNVYGSLIDDVWRRDFTVNALYYNIADFTIVDYANGLADLKARVLRMIGDPHLRYREDPVRMLRAIRFAAKLKFKIHSDTEKPIFELSALLSQVAPARLFDEYLKLFLSGFAYDSFQLLRKYKFLVVLFPLTEKYLVEEDTEKQAEKFLHQALINTDKRWVEEKPVAQPFLLAVFLWHPLKSLAEKKQSQGFSEYLAYLEAFHEVMNAQQKALAIPKRLVQIIREIWSLQLHLKNRAGKRAARLYANARFRAAYDFMILRGEAGDFDAQSLAAWWQDYIAADEKTREKMALNIQPPKRKLYRRRSKSTEKKTA